jgi:methionyl-tRNA formyltransferase
LRIVFMGSPEIAIPPLQNLIQNGHEVVAVYTKPDKPAGRGRAPVPPPIKIAALSLNVKVIQSPYLKQKEDIKQLRQLRPDAIVVAAFGQLLPREVLEIPRYGCLNIHPSLLPRYRGPSPVASALLAGDEFGGVSVMLLDVGMDTGPIYSQAQIPILEWDNNLTLTQKLFQIGAGMLIEALAFLPSGKIHLEPQNEKYASVSRELSKEDGKIDWSLSVRQIWRSIRAYQPWPGAYSYWQGKQIKIVDAVPLNEVESRDKGRVVSLTPETENSGAAFGITTGGGILGVINLQMEGKRIMSGQEFLRGQKDFMGSRLEPSC